MQWSKLKQKVESFFAASVRGRAELRSTRYRGAHDDDGRGYITFDKNEVWNMCTLKYYPLEYGRIEQIVNSEGIAPYQAQKIALKEFEKEGVFSQHGFYASLEDYCSLSIDDAIASQNALIRALAMLDSRLGRRRLSKMDMEGEHEMVRRFHAFRCSCEGIKITTSSHSH